MLPSRSGAIYFNPQGDLPASPFALYRVDGEGHFVLKKLLR